MAGSLKMLARFALGLGSFLREPLPLADARGRVTAHLRGRDDAFLRILRRGIFDNPASPYLALLRHAAIEFGDVVELVRRGGVEGALRHLYEAGVRVSLEEFKGRRPIERPGLSLPASGAAFDNPLLAAHYKSSTGGSRSVGGRGADRPRPRRQRGLLSLAVPRRLRARGPADGAVAADAPGRVRAQGRPRPRSCASPSSGGIRRVARPAGRRD